MSAVESVFVTFQVTKYKSSSLAKADVTKFALPYSRQAAKQFALCQHQQI